MGKAMKQNLQVLSNLKDGYFVKMITQLLLSLSLFSFLFSHSSFLSLIHSLNFCVSTLPYQLFTHTIDKKCIFLLCNGLLVFLAKYSGLVRSSQVDQSEFEDKDMVIGVSQSHDEDQLPTMPMYKVGHFDKEDNDVALKEEVETETETEKGAIFDDEEHEQGSEFEELKDSNEDDDEEEQEQEEKEGEKILVHVSEDVCDDWSNEFEEEEEIENEKLSTEEMDKKFDEFIRRMKEGLRIEAQRQLIMV